MSAKGYEVIGIDNLNNYYDVQLKLDRLINLGIRLESGTNLNQKPIQSKKFQKLSFLQVDITDYNSLYNLIKQERVDKILHLAAQAGVRYSIEKPNVYVESNILGFFNILEISRQFGIRHLVYASSSSVYGNRSKVPFSEDDRVDEPVSFYAATKKSNELMAYAYSHLYGFSCTGLRFFTVYGPWGRPDMAAFLFTKAILNGKPIDVYNHGELWRDFTFIDDIVEGILGVLNKELLESRAQIFNIGKSEPVKLLDFINTLEGVLNKQANLNMREMQDGDVHKTFASVSRLKDYINYEPSTDIVEGLTKFADWYNAYYSKQ